MTHRAMPTAAADAVAARLQHALGVHQSGELARAEALCRQILAEQPQHADALHLLGLLYLERGQAQAAHEWIGASLRVNPAQPVAHLNLGVALQRLQRPTEALASFRSALQLLPDYAEALNNLGDTLLALGRPAEAFASFERALQLQPQFALAWNNRGNALRALQRPAEALASYERALAIDPRLLRAWNNRGSALRDLRRLPEALASFEQALRLDPNYAAALHNRGNALLELKRYSEALECYSERLRQTPDDPETLTHQAIALLALKRAAAALISVERALRGHPDLALAHNMRGNALRALKQPQAALDCYREALRLDPDDADALCNRGNALYELRRYSEALASFEAALARCRDKADIYHNRGNVWQALEQPAQALEDFEQALRIDPKFSHALFAAANASMRLKRFDLVWDYFARLHAADPDYPFADGVHLHARSLECDWAGAEGPRRRVHSKLRSQAAADLPFSFLAVCDDPALQLQCARTLMQERYAPTGPTLQGDRRHYGHEKIRLAYVSADLRAHAVSRLLAGVWERHDRRRFEVIGVALNSEDASPFGQRVRHAFDRYIDASRLDDTELTHALRSSEIDIAVDLTGYTDGQRTGVFAARAAPVQVNYLGFPGTLGAEYFDYIIADRYLIPEDSQRYYAENVVYLPDCFQANDAQRAVLGELPTRAQLGLPRQAFVWCCMNSSFKLNAALFDIWMRLLEAVPGSVLWLVGGSSTAEVSLRREAGRRGVHPERLLFAPRVGYEHYLARFARADLFLDTLPFNAGATASDALWAGLPVLTCAGRAFAARMGGSLLHAVGVPELICDNLEHYEERALQLAHSPSALATLRQKLAEQHATCALFDTQRFCMHLESAFEHMWRCSERGEMPASFAVGS